MPIANYVSNHNQHHSTKDVNCDSERVLPRIASSCQTHPFMPER